MLLTQSGGKMLELNKDLKAHLQELAGRIGIRYVGSQGNHAAAEYIRREMEQAGLAVELQESECPDWVARRTVCEADGISMRVFVDPFSSPVDVTAPIVPVCTIAELEAADLRGKIALLYGDLMEAPVSPKAWFLKTEHDDRIITLLEQKAPAAVLSAQPIVPFFAHGFCDAEFSIPSATLPREAALDLLCRKPQAVHLLLDTERRPGSTANVVGRIAGTRPETIVLCAHYDTALITPGACDNAGGAAIILALASHFAAQRSHCSLEFAVFSGHEYLPLGVDAYWKTAEAGKLIAAVNFDGAGHRLATNTLTAMAASDDLLRAAHSKLKSYPGSIWVDPWPESDHSAFAMCGVPALALGSVGARDVTHSAADTVDGVSIEKLNEAASLAAEIVTELQEKTVEWGRT
jgi:aminopeptidase YwaD